MLTCAMAVKMLVLHDAHLDFAAIRVARDGPAWPDMAHKHLHVRTKVLDASRRLW